MKIMTFLAPITGGSIGRVNVPGLGGRSNRSFCLFAGGIEHRNRRIALAHGNKAKRARLFAAWQSEWTSAWTGRKFREQSSP
ncbi:hypothetical protein [Bradyrhizobium sp. USDA 10063]